MPHEDGLEPRDAMLADIADRIVHVARKLNARPHRDSRIVPLTSLEALVLRHIDRNAGISSTQLATDLELRSSNASTVLHSLVNKGLLAREQDPSDRRAARFTLTTTAHESVVRLRTEWSRTLGAILPDTLDTASALALLTALDEGLA